MDKKGWSDGWMFLVCLMWCLASLNVLVLHQAKARAVAALRRMPPILELRLQSVSGESAVGPTMMHLSFLGSAQPVVAFDDVSPDGMYRFAWPNGCTTEAAIVAVTVATDRLRCYGIDEAAPFTAGVHRPKPGGVVTLVVPIQCEPAHAKRDTL